MAIVVFCDTVIVLYIKPLCKSTKHKAKGTKIAYARHEGYTTLGLMKIANHSQ